METCFKKYNDIRKSKHTLERKRFGEFSYKSFKDWKPFTMHTYYIEILSLQMYFLIEMDLQSLVIWTWAKLQRKDFYILKLALRIMPHLRFGKISHMIVSQIFGR